MFFGRLGWIEVVLIIGIILIIFGPGKLPGLSRSVGEAIRNYRRGVSGKDEEQEESTADTGDTETEKAQK